MRSADVVPGNRYAVKRGSDVESAEAHVKLPTGKWRVILRSGDVAHVSPVNILAPWNEYVFLRDWDEALDDNAARDSWARVNKLREERKARIESWIGAFDGLMVPAESLSSANFERPDVDLGADLRETFIEFGVTGKMIRLEAFEAIASRMKEMQEALLTAESGWSMLPGDTNPKEDS
jgi:hypothetical protein